MQYFDLSRKDNFATHVLYICVCLLIACAAPAFAQSKAPNIPASGANAAISLISQASSPVAAGPALAATPTTPLSSYRINSGDGIEIYVWGEERLQRSLTVLPDGTIAFPLVGQLRVAGLLPQDVENLVSERLRGQYRGEVPVVTVSVAQTAGLQFSIMGKVRSPGSFTTGRYLNILEALSLAGGPAEFAKLDDITLIREQGGEILSIRLRLAKLFKPGVSPRDVQRAGIVRIQPGDVLIVP